MPLSGSALGRKKRFKDRGYNYNYPGQVHTAEGQAKSGRVVHVEYQGERGADPVTAWQYKVRTEDGTEHEVEVGENTDERLYWLSWDGAVELEEGNAGTFRRMLRQRYPEIAKEVL